MHGSGFKNAMILLVAFNAACGFASEKPAPGVKEFLDHNCSECHDADTQKGKFRVDNLPLDLAAPDAAKRWGRVLTRLESGEMPPPKHERPPEAALAATLAWTKSALATEAKMRRSDGRTRIRRLNRLEYEHTVHDLLGIETPLQDLLPGDDFVDGFDTGAAGPEHLACAHPALHGRR